MAFDYPIFLNLERRRCVVIGGGRVAERKVRSLLACGARVTLVSPEVTGFLARSASQGTLKYVCREFQPGDLRGAWLVYAATGEQAINAAVARAAEQRRIFSNVVDRSALCSFIAPAIFRRRAVTIGISTGGASPSMAKRIRATVARAIRREDVAMVTLLAGLRPMAQRTLLKPAQRKRYFKRVLSGSVPALVRAGAVKAARREALRLLEREA